VLYVGLTLHTVFPRLECAHFISFTLLSWTCSSWERVVFEGTF